MPINSDRATIKYVTAFAKMLAWISIYDIFHQTAFVEHLTDSTNFTVESIGTP